MTRDEALTILRREKPRLTERYGVKQLALFGSVARNESTINSDVDILVQLERPDLFTLVHLHADLESVLQSTVDLVRDHDGLRPLFRQRLLRDGHYV
jgi:hypothetical protein